VGIDRKVIKFALDLAMAYLSGPAPSVM